MRRLVMVLGLLSCNAPTASGPPLKDWSATYPPLLEKLPAGSNVLMVADWSHFVERVAAMERVVASSPRITPFLGMVKDKIGWDVFDPKVWETLGWASRKPAAFVLKDDHAFLYFQTTDGAKLKAALDQLLGQTLECTQHDPWLVCGDPGRAPPDPPADAKSSVWAQLAQSVPAEVRKMDVLGFAPLTDQVKDAPEFLRGSRAVWLGLRMDESEMHFTAGYENAQLRDLEKYLRLPAGTPTVLGAARGSDGTVRMTFAPKVLWELAKEKMPEKELNQMTGGFAMVTGMDLEKDVVENLTGEIVAAMTSSGMAFDFGARDQKKTAALLEKLDNLAAGASSALNKNPSSGMSFTRTSDEIHGAKAYHYKMVLPPEISKLQQPLDYEIHFAAGKGALVWAMDRGGLEGGLAALGQPASQFLDELPPDARAIFASNAPMVGYFRSIDPQRWMKGPMMDMAKLSYDKYSPALWPIVMDLMKVWELIWDGTTVFDVHDGRADLDYVVRFL